MSDSLRLADLDPRTRKMLQLILRNQDQICRPGRGILELHFKGYHVNARLVSHQTIALDDGENDGPPEAA